jgi:tetratricopeptide (TPR) repeat protein
MTLSGSLLLEQGSASSLEPAIQRLEKVVAADPSNAVARGLLARAFARVAVQSPRPAPDAARAAREHARLVLAGAPGNADALAALGGLQFWIDHDMQGAGDTLTRAVRAPHASRDAQNWYAAWLTVTGEHERAVHTARNIEDAAPLTIASAPLARSLFYARRYDEAIEAAAGMLALHPRATQPAILKYVASIEAGRAEDALADLTGWIEQALGRPWVPPAGVQSGRGCARRCCRKFSSSSAGTATGSATPHLPPPSWRHNWATRRAHWDGCAGAPTTRFHRRSSSTSTRRSIASARHPSSGTW